MIILNEIKYAEECLKNHHISKKPFYSLSIMSKYYYYHLGCKKKEIVELLIDFMSKYYPKYELNKRLWDDSIEKMVKNVNKFELYNIPGVWITSNELSVILGIRNKILERLMFSILCLAKLSNIKNKSNNNWVNIDAKDLFSLARISCPVIDRYRHIGKLGQLGLLEFPKSNEKLSFRVTFLEDDGNNELFISDFRELGYEYKKYIGENYIRCEKCGRLIHGSKNSRKKYCSSCSGYHPKKFKKIICQDCGEEIEVSGNNKRTIRCGECQKKYIKKYDRERKSRCSVF